MERHIRIEPDGAERQRWASLLQRDAPRSWKYPDLRGWIKNFCRRNVIPRNPFLTVDVKVDYARSRLESWDLLVDQTFVPEAGELVGTWLNDIGDVFDAIEDDRRAFVRGPAWEEFEATCTSLDYGIPYYRLLDVNDEVTDLRMCDVFKGCCHNKITGFVSPFYFVDTTFVQPPVDFGGPVAEWSVVAYCLDSVGKQHPVLHITAPGSVPREIWNMWSKWGAILGATRLPYRPDPEYVEAVMDALRVDVPGLEPEQVAFRRVVHDPDTAIIHSECHEFKFYNAFGMATDLLINDLTSHCHLLLTDAFELVPYLMAAHSQWQPSENGPVAEIVHQGYAIGPSGSIHTVYHVISEGTIRPDAWQRMQDESAIIGGYVPSQKDQTLHLTILLLEILLLWLLQSTILAPLLWFAAGLHSAHLLLMPECDSLRSKTSRKGCKNKATCQLFMWVLLSTQLMMPISACGPGSPGLAFRLTWQYLFDKGENLGRMAVDIGLPVRWMSSVYFLCVGYYLTKAFASMATSRPPGLRHSFAGIKTFRRYVPGLCYLEDPQSKWLWFYPTVRAIYTNCPGFQFDRLEDMGGLYHYGQNQVKRDPLIFAAENGDKRVGGGPWLAIIPLTIIGLASNSWFMSVDGFCYSGATWLPFIWLLGPWPRVWMVSPFLRCAGRTWKLLAIPGAIHLEQHGNATCEEVSAFLDAHPSWVIGGHFGDGIKPGFYPLRLQIWRSHFEEVMEYTHTVLRVFSPMIATFVITTAFWRNLTYIGLVVATIRGGYVCYRRLRMRECFIFRPYGTTGDHLPLRRYYELLKMHGFQVFWNPMCSEEEGAADLAKLERGSTLENSPKLASFVATFLRADNRCFYIAPWFITPSVRNILRYDLAPIAYARAHIKVAGDVTFFGGLSNIACNVSSLTSDKLLFGCFPGALPRLKSDLTYVSKYPEPDLNRDKILVTPGSSSNKVPMEVLARIKGSHPGFRFYTTSLEIANDVPGFVYERRTDHDDWFQEFDTIYCHGGAGTVDTARAAGCKVVSLSKLIDRDQYMMDLETEVEPLAIISWMYRDAYVGLMVKALIRLSQRNSLTLYCLFMTVSQWTYSWTKTVLLPSLMVDLVFALKPLSNILASRFYDAIPKLTVYFGTFWYGLSVILPIVRPVDAAVIFMYFTAYLPWLIVRITSCTSQFYALSFGPIAVLRTVIIRWVYRRWLCFCVPPLTSIFVKLTNGFRVQPGRIYVCLRGRSIVKWMPWTCHVCFITTEEYLDFELDEKKWTICRRKVTESDWLSRYCVFPTSLDATELDSLQDVMKTYLKEHERDYSINGNFQATPYGNCHWLTLRTLSQKMIKENKSLLLLPPVLVLLACLTMLLTPVLVSVCLVIFALWMVIGCVYSFTTGKCQMAFSLAMVAHTHTCDCLAVACNEANQRLQEACESFAAIIDVWSEAIENRDWLWLTEALFCTPEEDTQFDEAEDELLFKMEGLKPVCLKELPVEHFGPEGGEVDSKVEAPSEEEEDDSLDFILSKIWENVKNYPKLREIADRGTDELPDLKIRQPESIFEPVVDKTTFVEKGCVAITTSNYPEAVKSRFALVTNDSKSFNQPEEWLLTDAGLPYWVVDYCSAVVTSRSLKFVTNRGLVLGSYTVPKGGEHLTVWIERGDHNSQQPVDGDIIWYPDGNWSQLPCCPWDDFNSNPYVPKKRIRRFHFNGSEVSTDFGTFSDFSFLRLRSGRSMSIKDFERELRCHAGAFTARTERMMAMMPDVPEPLIEFRDWCRTLGQHLDMWSPDNRLKTQWPPPVENVRIKKENVRALWLHKFPKFERSTFEEVLAARIRVANINKRADALPLNNDHPAVRKIAHNIKGPDYAHIVGQDAVNNGMDGQSFATRETMLASLSAYTRYKESELESEAVDELAKLIADNSPGRFYDCELTDPAWLARQYLSKRKYSAGVDFLRSGIFTRSEIRRGGYFKSLVAMGVEPYKTGVWHPALIHAFPKTQIVKMEKLVKNPAALRSITAASGADNISQGIGCACLNARHHWGSWGKVGMPTMGAVMQEYFARFEECDFIVSLDVTAFDRNIPHCLLKVVTAVRKLGFKDHPLADVIGRHLECAEENTRTAYIVNLVNDRLADLRGTLDIKGKTAFDKVDPAVWAAIDSIAKEVVLEDRHCPGGYLLKITGGNTGDFNVTATNSTVLAAAVIHSVSKMTGRPYAEFNDYAVLGNLSDDNNLGFKTSRMKEKPDIPQLLEIFKADFDLDVRVESTGDSIWEQTFLAKHPVPGETFAADFKLAGLPVPKMAIVHDRERLLRSISQHKVGDNRHFTKTKAARVNYQLERIVGLMQNTCHHRDLYEGLAAEAAALRRSQPKRLRRVKIPSYATIMQKYYSPHRLPEYDHVHFPLFAVLAESAYCTTLRETDAVLREANNSVPWAHLGEFGEYVKTEIEVTPGFFEPHMWYSFFAENGRPPERAELDNLCRLSAFGNFCNADKWMDTTGDFYPMDPESVAVGRSFTTWRMLVYTGVYIWTTSSLELLNCNFYGRVMLRIIQFCRFDAPNLFAAGSHLHFVANGKPSAALSRLMPKDRNYYYKKFALFVAKPVDPPIWIAAIPAPALLRVLSNALEIVAGVRMASITKRIVTADVSKSTPWTTVALDITSYFIATGPGIVTVSAPCGTGKTRYLPDAFLNPEIGLVKTWSNVVVVMPRRILCEEYERRKNVVWKRQGVSDVSDHMVCTYGYLAMCLTAGRPEWINDNTIMIYDESHERLAEWQFIIQQEMASKYSVLLTATPLPWMRKYAHFTVPVDPLFPVTYEQPLTQSVFQEFNVRKESCERILIIIPGLHEGAEMTKQLRRTGVEITHVSSQTPTIPKTGHIIATSIADASLTIPGCDCVIDSGRSIVNEDGKQRTVVYDKATRIQRAGRTGRTNPGIYISFHDPVDHTYRVAPGLDLVLNQSPILKIFETTVTLEPNTHVVESHKVPTDCYARFVNAPASKHEAVAAGLYLQALNATRTSATAQYLMTAKSKEHVTRVLKEHDLTSYPTVHLAKQAYHALLPHYKELDSEETGVKLRYEFNRVSLCETKDFSGLAT